MNDHNRPHNPSDPEAKPANPFFGDAPATPASDDAEASAAPKDTVLDDPYARPMSERQRRRLAEQQRLAEARAAQADNPGNGFLSPLSESADSPPATTTSRSPSVKATKTKSTTKSKSKSSGGTGVYLLATLAAALWAGGIASFVAYEFGSGMVDLDPVRVAVYALIALAPVGLIYLLAYISRLGSGLAAESRRARELAEAMVAPTAYAAHEAGGILSVLRTDIETASQTAERARQELSQLREMLAAESGRLNDAAHTAQAATQNITMQLGKERESLGALGLNLDQQALSVTEAVNRQAQMVADASDLAQAQLREAEAALAARAADLAAAANEAQDAARVAAEDLSRQTLRLETAGTGVTDQIKAVEDGLSQQRAALVTAAYALRTDQEDFAAQIESQRAQFIDHLSITRSSAAELNATGDQIAEAIKTQVEAVLDQFRTLVCMSQREADGFDAATKVSLDKFEVLAAESRDRLLEETARAIETLHAAAAEQRNLAEQALQQAQIRADRLGESLFDAARQADDAAEARIEGVRRIVGDTLQMLDQTGAEASNRLESLTQRMTDALTRIEASVREMDERAARMPDEAVQRVNTMRATVEQGLASLTDASRRAAADTEALDAGFQDRVRRNYEKLTEAARLMTTPENTAQPKPAPQPALAPQPEPEAPREQTAPKSIADSGLSWRDVAPTAMVPPQPAPQAAQPVAAPMPSLSVLSEHATSAIRRMGVDPNALLPRARIEDVAFAIARQDISRARQIVRRVAPAAVRSVARRVNGDTEAHAYISTFIDQYAQMLASNGNDQDAIQTRLATDEGRAFMLFDAALGEIA